MCLLFNRLLYSVIILLFMLAGLSACAGYRMGYFSMPYLSENIPSGRTSSNISDLFKMKRVQFQGFVLSVDLDNEMQTSHTAWAGPVPLRMDLETKKGMDTDNPGKFCIEIQFIPEVTDIVFQPGLASLVIDGVSFPVTSSRTFQYIHYKKEMTGISNGPIALDTMGDRYSYNFSLCFETQKPSPDQVITLDLTRAITVSGQKKGQMIYFRKTRYRHGYT